MEPILAITPSVNINLTLPLTAPVPPPPTYSRMPPDGHEFPSNYREEEQQVSSTTIAAASSQQEQQESAAAAAATTCCSGQLTTIVSSTRIKSCQRVDDEEIKLSEDSGCRKSSTCSTSGSMEDSSSYYDVVKATNNSNNNIYARRPKLWNKDEKSERSVKDKIAMFSNGATAPPGPAVLPIKTTKLAACKSAGGNFDLPSSKAFSKSVFSIVDETLSGVNNTNNNNNNTNNNNNNSCSNSNNLDYSSRARSSIDLTLPSSSSAYSSESSLSPVLSYGTTAFGTSSTLPRKTTKTATSSSSSVEFPVSSIIASTDGLLLTTTDEGISSSSSKDKKSTLIRATSFAGSSNLHCRSQSLSDGLHHCPIVRRNSEETTRSRDSLSQLIEQRRRTMSKLRGLVIPEKVVENHNGVILLDLPEIKSKDSNSSPFDYDGPTHSSMTKSTIDVDNFTVPPPPPGYPLIAADGSNNSAGVNHHLDKITAATIDVWKSSDSSSDIPKYSPAFKRKSLALCGGLPSTTSSVSSSSSSSREELRMQTPPVVIKSIPPSKPPRTSLYTTGYRSNLNQSLDQNDTSIPSSTAAHNNNNNNNNNNNWKYDEIDGVDGKLTKQRQHQNHNEERISNVKSVKTPDDSDNDSAVSSSRSSLCHDLSPSSSPTPISRNQSTYIEEEDRIMKSVTTETASSQHSTSSNRTLRRTLSSDTTISTTSSVSTLTSASSGSRASCSSSSSSSSSGGEVNASDDLNSSNNNNNNNNRNDSTSNGKRILKPQSVEAINRKNVLSSARYSSGQDYKHIFASSIERAFVAAEKNDNNGHGGGSGKNMKKPNNIHQYSDYIHLNNDSNNHNNNNRRFEDFEIAKSTDNNLINNYQDNDGSADNIKVAYIEIRENSDDELISSKSGGIETEEEMPLEESWSTCESDKDSSADNLDGKDLLKSTTDDDSDVSHDDRYKRDNHLLLMQSQRSNNNNNNINNNNNNSKSLKDVSLDTIITEIRPDHPLMTTAYQSDKMNNFANNNNQTIAMAGHHHSAIGGGVVVGHRNGIVSKSSSLLNRAAASKRPSVTDLRKAFEKADISTAANISATAAAAAITNINSGTNINSTATINNNNNSNNNNNYRRSIDFRSKSLQQSQTHHSLKRDSHVRMSSLDSTTSEESFLPRSPSQYGSTSNLLLRDQQFGSITSLASSTSLISQQELQQLIEDANHTLEEETTGSEGYNVMVIILHRDTATSSVGITLAGGADYECKEITIHKVLSGSPADRDGRIQKGDRILSINGRNMKDVTHREALSILKAPRSEVVLVVSRWKADSAQCINLNEDPLVATFKTNVRPPRIPELNDVIATGVKPQPIVNRGPVTTITLMKDGGGLGFSLEGGKDSPFGDLPLTIKKIFTGGCADKSGLLSAGDELLSLNALDVTTMSRTEAWNVMKRLADGQVKLTVRRLLIT